MLPALSTPFRLMLRKVPTLRDRITFICCACMMLLTSCADFPDQDACIQIDANKNDGKYISVDTTRVYDTIASIIEFIVKYKNGAAASNWPVSFFIDSNEIKKPTDKSGRTFPLWVKEGNYSFGIGDSWEYPCILIHNLWVPGGRGYEITVTLPTNE